jgi:hypothetical protein
MNNGEPIVPPTKDAVSLMSVAACKALKAVKRAEGRPGAARIGGSIRGIWPEFRHASEQNSEPQPTYEIYPIFTLRISVRYVPLRAVAFEIPRKCSVFLRKMGLFLNGVQKVVSSNLTAPTI